MTELLWDVADWTVELVVQREGEREERREKKRGERREVEVDAAYLRHRARKWCGLSSTEVALSRLLSSDCNYVYRTFRTWTGGTQNSRSSYVSVDKVRKVQTLALLMSTFPLSYIPDMCMTCKPPLRYHTVCFSHAPPHFNLYSPLSTLRPAVEVKVQVISAACISASATLAIGMCLALPCLSATHSIRSRVCLSRATLSSLTSR